MKNFFVSMQDACLVRLAKVVAFAIVIVAVCVVGVHFFRSYVLRADAAVERHQSRLITDEEGQYTVLINSCGMIDEMPQHNKRIFIIMMRYTVDTGKLIDAAGDAAIIIVPENPDFDAFDPAIAVHIRRLIGLGDFAGKAETNSLVYTNDGIEIPRILFVGAGKQEAQKDIENTREIYGLAARILSEMGLKSATLPVTAAATPQELEAAATAISLSLYQFNLHKTQISDAEKNHLQSVTFFTEDAQRKPMIEAAVRRGELIANGTIFARDLSNAPGNYLTPKSLAEKAEAIAAASGLNCEIFDKATLEEKGFRTLLAVAQGSVEEPRFIILEYVPDGEGQDTVVLVGKGITFDTGGINIKPADGLIGMKCDMAGAAAVIGAMSVIGHIKPNVRVIALVAAAENMPGSKALRPDDIITSYGGKTIEILNTDAEGRLVLADTLGWAAQYNAKAVIDLATLTGAVLGTFGKHCAGAMTNDAPLMAKVSAAAIKTHERVWELPLWDDYDKDVKSTVADIKNLGDGRNAGTIAAGKFLQAFVEHNYPWVHLDIAGTAWDVKGKSYIPENGASGYGVQLLVQLVEDW